MSIYFSKVGRQILGIAGIMALGAASQAASFTYTNGDLLAGFRRVGSSSDLVVDLGPVSYYRNLPVGTVVTVAAAQPSQLNAAVGTLNGVNWSVSGAIRSASPDFPLQTIWATSPRSDASVPSSPWKRAGAFTQGVIAAEIDAIGNDGALYGSVQPAGTNNTSTGIVIPSTLSYSYTAHVTSSGNFGSFQGSVENATASDFTTSGVVSRSDLYELVPGSGASLNAPGKLLGSFDFRADGTLTFTAGAPVTPSAISSLQRAGNVVTIQFSTVNAANYRLRFTNAAGLSSPVSNWSIGGATLTGNGSVLSLQDTNSGQNLFYVVEAYQ